MKYRQPVTFSNAIERLRDLCSRGEYSSGEIASKLRLWGIGGADSLRIIDILKRGKYIDDCRFAQSFTYTKVINSRWGKLKIKHHLYKKGIAHDLIEYALDTIEDEDYEGILRTVIENKRRDLGYTADTYEGRTKIFRYAASRGFEPSLVAAILRE